MQDLGIHGNHLRMKARRISSENKTAGRPKSARIARASTVRPGKARAIRTDRARRTAARRAYRAEIESLLEKSADRPLAAAWRRVCPVSLDRPCELPNRRGMIRDLVDFAVVLQPSLEGMQAERLCWLIGKYAAYKPRRSDLAVSRPARQGGTREHRSATKSCSKEITLLHG